jgi:hypothetical protein
MAAVVFEFGFHLVRHVRDDDVVGKGWLAGGRNVDGGRLLWE